MHGFEHGVLVADIGTGNHAQSADEAGSELLLGNAARDTLWLLSRQPAMDAARRQALLQQALSALAAIAGPASELREQWLAHVASIFSEATLTTAVPMLPVYQ